MPDSPQEIRRRLERLAWLLDNSIPVPGLNIRFGLDSILGLIPGVGDALGALVSSYILGEAARLGAPKSVLLKMTFNVAVDALLGAIPVLGDIFDVTWKANHRNVRLLEEFAERPRKTVVVSRFFVWGLSLLIFGFVLFIVILGILFVRWLWLTLTGV